MSKNKKNKLSVDDMAFICGMLHLDRVRMRKYGRKMYKNAPRLRKIFDRIEKDNKVLLSFMLGYHMAKMEKLDKKMKKASANTHKSSKKHKADEGNAYWKTNTERDSVDDSDQLHLPEIVLNLDSFTDNNTTDTTAAENTTAPIENPQDMHSDDKESEDVNSEPTRCVNSSDATGAATVNTTYMPVSGTVVAGCDVYYGTLKANAKAQVIRNGIVVYEGVITKLKRYKDEVNEVCSGFTCGVIVEGCTDYRWNDIIKCFDSDSDADTTNNTDTDTAAPHTDDESSSNQYTVPKYIDGGHFKILVTDVDIDNGKLTYLDLGEWCNVTPARVSSALSATELIGEAAHCELAEKFGIDPEYVNSGVQFIRTELPTKDQIEALKDFDISRFDTVLNSRFTDKPILVDDGTEEGKHKSRTVVMPDGKIAKRQSNWYAVLIPSVTIEF